ncbi:hypothetical protein BpHYR1_015502 [Brachionus plicatilis]|uniref:Uncharacterized protein n=1 Tax=Brachionus plicatilis TaxID=10195 RepID=A0A3M7RAJ5_BRAPC|nr:hypothetical protein BpHYR1_015502 [Brachionus plicatilis]
MQFVISYDIYQLFNLVAFASLLDYNTSLRNYLVAITQWSWIFDISLFETFSIFFYQSDDQWDRMTQS